MKKRSVYVLLEFPNMDDDSLQFEDIMPFIVGVFSKASIAEIEAEYMFKKNKGKYLYFIEDYELNTPYLKSEEEAERELSEALEQMVKEGIVDYKIGEDGDFYFEVVDRNKKDGKKL